jgi:hypothetical protein
VDFAREWPEDRADARGIAENFRGGDDEALSGAKHDGAASSKGAGANLGALQIRKNGDGLFLFDGGSAKGDDILSVLGVSAMRKIQASDVHAGFEQAANHAGRAASGADGTNDF